MRLVRRDLTRLWLSGEEILFRDAHLAWEQVTFRTTWRVVVHLPAFRMFNAGEYVMHATTSVGEDVRGAVLLVDPTPTTLKLEGNRELWGIAEVAEIEGRGVEPPDEAAEA